ncbi:hypothetical protein GCM10010210_24680 [Pseudonocardia hydrocarbonoxydans]|uniref:Uncharacterized protein n=1 Tax=Pseudonocardia hydrocarbonoxydans TaxID=76726 RepID=A0A4Y3WL84_9PSEU|nr:hypothetical protein PHY01_18270 [Pseudonocardia hydrocarbonoxydans]
MPDSGTVHSTSGGAGAAGADGRAGPRERPPEEGRPPPERRGRGLAGENCTRREELGEDKKGTSGTWHVSTERQRRDGGG